MDNITRNINSLLVCIIWIKQYKCLGTVQTQYLEGGIFPSRIGGYLMVSILPFANYSQF